jgi:HEAT repeat protein
MRLSDFNSRNKLDPSSWLVSFTLLALPAAVLGLLAWRTRSMEVAAGAGVLGLFVLIFIRAHPVWRPPVSVTVVLLYLMALVWAWLPLRGSADWAPHLAQGVLLVVGVMLLAAHDLARTGAEPLRRANLWTHRIKTRRYWPELSECRVLPEAAGLRAAVREQAGPALALLADPRPEVQAVALGALEHRPYWREGEGQYVLRFGQKSEEPAVRAAAIHALAGTHIPDLIAGIAAFLRDPEPEVRQAATEALMWEADTRWPFAREGIREAMADNRFSNEGPMFSGIGRLPAAAIADMTTWSSEHAPLASRAIMTLIEHYHTELSAGQRPELGSELSTLMLNNETSPALRVELAALLREHHLLSADLLDRLTNLDQPGPMRLFAAELMLRINPHDPDGIDVLRGLARQPNREMSIHVAAVLQNVLGIQLGLTEGELPLPNSKQAAEIARSVLSWANGADPDVLRPTPGPRAGMKPVSRHSLPSIGSRPSLPTMPPVPQTPPPVEADHAADNLDDSAMLPATAVTDQVISPTDESGMLPREDSPKPPPIPKRLPSSGSSAVI